MAEIRIQEKKRPVWPWILLIILLVIAALLLYYFLNRDDNGTEYESVPADTTVYYDQDQGNVMPPAKDIDQYAAFTSADTTGVFNKEYVSNGFNLLTGAVYEVMNREDTSQVQLGIKLDSLRSFTLNLTDTSNTNFSRDVNRSMTTSYDILSSLQEKSYPDAEEQVKELSSIARSYKPNTSVEEQEKTVREFFSVSGSILSGMKNTGRRNY
jgi:hypothetical protein